MSYEVLEKQIRALPEAAVMEVEHYVDYLYSKYNCAPQKDELGKINALYEQLDNESKGIKSASLECMKEALKNDTW